MYIPRRIWLTLNYFLGTSVKFNTDIRRGLGVQKTNRDIKPSAPFLKDFSEFNISIIRNGCPAPKIVNRGCIAVTVSFNVVRLIWESPL